MDLSVDCTNVKMVGQSITIYSVTFTLIHFIKAGRKKHIRARTCKTKQNKKRKKAAQQIQDACTVYKPLKC